MNNFIINNITRNCVTSIVVNNSNVRINELQYPLFEFEQINENLDLDELILPQGLGNKIKNPHDFIKNRHTEYMAADYKNIWGIYLFPGEMSMPLIGVQSGNKYLYMGWHSKIWREFTLTIGTEPRNSSEKYIIYAISSYPMVKPGENITYDDFVLAAFDGDWRNGVDFYRRWADKEWNTSFNKKHSVNTLCGWQRIILNPRTLNVRFICTNGSRLYIARAVCPELLHILHFRI